MRLLKRLSLLRKILAVEERQAVALEKIAAALAPTRMHVRTTKAELDTLDVAWMNKRYDEELRSREEGLELEPEE